MKQQSILYGIIGLLTGSLLTILIASNAVNNSNTGMMQMMGMRRQNTNMNIDQHFIEQMIPHHEDAITMAKLALENATRSEVKTLAQNIIDSQSKEIDQMKIWYKKWYGKAVPQDEQIMGMHGMQRSQGMHMGMMGDESDLRRLEQSSDFDRAFVEEMIPHHQMAVMMASMLRNGTQRPEMKQLAEDIITAQLNEIDQMRKWLIELE